MTQVVSFVVVTPDASPALPCAIDIALMTEAEFLTFALHLYRDKRDPWRMDAAQMKEDLPGVETISNCIFF